MCFSLNTDKYNELDANHFILEDIEGKIDFGEEQAVSMHRARITRSLQWMESTARWLLMNMEKDIAYTLQVFHILHRTVEFFFVLFTMQQAWKRDEALLCNKC